jgi:hypothetical protein
MLDIEPKNLDQSDVKLTNTKTEFLGWDKLTVKQKEMLFDIVESYLTIKYCLRTILKLNFANNQIADVLGVVMWRTEMLEKGCDLAAMLLNHDITVRSEYIDNFGWNDLREITDEMEKAKKSIREINGLSWWYRFYIGLRYRDWKNGIFAFAKFFLNVFLFLSLIYVLIATDFGRNLSWEFLGVYSVIVKVLMAILLGVALIIIVILVSFMYFESKKKK